MAGEKTLRILSLLPAATEIVFSLGLEKYLVGVSHECDYPPEAKEKPKVTSFGGHRGPGVFHIKEGILKKLRPNLILTQKLCEVCAVGFGEVKKAARILDSDTKIISLEPESVEDILDNIILIGESSGKSLESRKIVKLLKKRLKILDSRLSILAANKPKVCVVEWLEPLMVAGHWIPEMVQFAGGVNLISEAGQKSKKLTIHQIIAGKPDILIISPCGFDIDRTYKERFKIEDLRFKIKNKGLKTYLIDGNAYMTRPGPRIIDGIEILAEILHPDPPAGPDSIGAGGFPKRYSEKDWVEFR